MSETIQAVLSSFVTSFLAIFGRAETPPAPTVPDPVAVGSERLAAEARATEERERMAAEERERLAAEAKAAEERERLAVEARDTQLALIDAALRDLAVAVATVPAEVAALRAAADAPTLGFTAERSTLAAATTASAITPLLSGVATTLGLITAATVKAGEHAVTAAAVLTDRTEAARLLGLAKGIIDALATPGGLAGELATAQADPTAAADASTIAAAAAGWPVAAQALLDKAKAARDLEAKQVLQAAKLQEVNDALRDLATECGRRTAPFPVDPDNAVVARLEARRDDLAAAATIPEIDAELGTAAALLADIANAEAEATNSQVVWLALEARAKTCNTWLSATRGYLTGLTNPAKVAVESDLALAEGAYNDLGKCTTLTDYENAVAAIEPKLVPLNTAGFALLSDHRRDEAAAARVKLDAVAADYAKNATPHPLAAEIATLEGLRLTAEAETNVVQRGTLFIAYRYEVERVLNEAKALQVRRKDLVSWIDSTKQWIDTLPSGNPLTGRHTLATDELKRLDGEADLAAFDAGLAALLLVVYQLYEDALDAAAPENTSGAMRGLAGMVARFAKIGEPNPVKTLQVRLLGEQTAAASLVGTARTNALVALGAAAGTATTEAEAALAAKSDIDRRLYALQQVQFKALGVAGGDPLEVERLRIVAALRTTCTGTPGEDIAALKAGFAALAGDVDALKLLVEAREAAALDIAAKTAEVKEGLVTLNGVLVDLAAGTDKSALESEASAAKVTLDGLPAAHAGNDPGHKTALFALGKQVEALMRRAGKAVFAGILAQPGGAGLVDGMVKAMGETTDNLVAQALCRAAMEARFGVTLDIPEGMSVERLPTLYQMFAKVPASHVGHEKLKKLEYETDPDMSSSYYSDGKVVLNKIGDGSGLYDMQGQGVGEDAKVVKVNYFKATTLHEIGHAVDDNKKVMKFGDDAYGGWKKETAASVAKALCDSFFGGFLGSGKGEEADMLEVIQALLEGGAARASKPASATAKLGSLFAEWDAIAASPGWANALKVRDSDKSPWNTPVVFTDGRAYHEGYAGDWFSYTHAERGKGVSNYQWRAPGEWFAELYAYHHMLGKPVPACVTTAITT